MEKTTANIVRRGSCGDIEVRIEAMGAQPVDADLVHIIAIFSALVLSCSTDKKLAMAGAFFELGEFIKTINVEKAINYRRRNHDDGKE